MKPETYVEIDLDALTHNISVMKNVAGSAEILAVLKANAYGHGSVEIMKALQACGITRFAVANFSEAMELRRFDPNASIMILGFVAEKNIEKAAEENFIFTVFSKEYWQSIKKHAKKPVTLHIKVNTGFNRIGFEYCDDAFETIEDMSHIATIEGAYSHLALASKEDDLAQYKRFCDFTQKVESMGIGLKIKHIADSISTVIHPWSRLDMVRLGAVMYGLKAGYGEYAPLGLKPTMKMFSTVSQVHTIEAGEGISYDYTFKAEEKMEVAALAFGYADGPPRSMSNRAHVIINGQEAPIIGLMCMDQCMVDLRGISGVKMGDPVLIFDLDEQSPASVYPLSRQLKTNKNDIIAGIGKRVTRIYSQNGKKWSINDINIEEGK